MNQDKVLKTVSIILPLAVIFGNYSITGIEIAGLTLNNNRVVIPLLFIAFFFYSIKEKKQLIYSIGSNEKKMYCLMIIWVLYGVVTIVLFPYADFHEGLLEILSLVLGTMTMAITSMLCRNNMWEYLIIGMKISVIIICIIGLYEVITTNHLSTSRFSDPEFIRLNKEIFGDEAELLRWHLATSIFYNENDCSAMLAIFSALFLSALNDNRWWIRVVNIIGLCLVFSILFFNDAFICFIAFLVGVIVVLIFGVKSIKNRLVPIICLVLTRIIIVPLSKILGINVGLAGTLLAQIDNNASGMGSMYYRINTYRVTLHETFFTSKGMGFGAGSFSKYFNQFVDSHMIMSNPHCFWFEILSEYGVIVFLLFICLLVMIMVKLIMKYHQTKDSKYISIIACGLSLIIASVAPSSFLKYGYYWILIGMAVYLADDEVINNRKTSIGERYD